MAEKMARAETWARVLFGSIPANCLQVTFERAFADHDSAFPVNAYDLKATWEKMVKEYKEADRKAKLTELVADIHKVGYKICEVCGDTGFQHVERFSEQGKKYTGVIKSQDCCRYWQRRAEQALTPKHTNL